MKADFASFRRSLAKGAGSDRIHTHLVLKSAALSSRQTRPLMSPSDFRLLGYSEGIINLDAQVSHGRLKLGVTEHNCMARRFLVRR